MNAAEEPRRHVWPELRPPRETCWMCDGTGSVWVERGSQDGSYVSERPEACGACGGCGTLPVVA